MPNRGQRHLKRALQALLDGKQDKEQLYPGKLGAYVAGNPTIDVNGRPGFVWVRLRGSESERIAALNNNVAPVYDLPVLVTRDEINPKLWKVVGRDVGAYDNYQVINNPYLPKHGDSHSLSGADYTGGDTVWVYKRQFMPLLPRPNETGSFSIYIQGGYYEFDGVYKQWPGSGTAALDGYRPTGSETAKFVTVSIESETGVLLYTEGDIFNAYNAPPDLTPLVPIPDEIHAIPIASIFLMESTAFLGWGEIYDLRFVPKPIIDSNAIYGMYGQPTYLDVPTGIYWKIPGDSYATGTLGLWINGVAQLPGINYIEQYPASGTFQIDEYLPTGSVLTVHFGVR